MAAAELETSYLPRSAALTGFGQTAPLRSAVAILIDKCQFHHHVRNMIYADGSRDTDVS